MLRVRNAGLSAASLAGPRREKEAIMHPRHGDDDSAQTSWLTAIAVALFLVLLASTAIRFDLWQVPEDQSATVLLPDGSTAQPVTTAARRD
jgi:hypothetical protein